MKNERPPEGYWHLVSRQFGKNYVAVSGLILILTLFAVAVLADFIANDKPLVMRYRSQIYFPILKQYAVSSGFSRWQSEFQNISFKEFAAANFKTEDWAQFPPLRYSPNEVNLNEPLRHPSRQHFFGTDEIGRDIASRVVHGSRVSLSVGFVAVGIYVVI